MQIFLPFMIKGGNVPTKAILLMNYHKSTESKFKKTTAEDFKDTNHVIVDYRVGICRFNVNKCDVTDTLLPHGAAKVSS